MSTTTSQSNTSISQPDTSTLQPNTMTLPSVVSTQSISETSASIPSSDKSANNVKPNIHEVSLRHMAGGCMIVPTKINGTEVSAIIDSAAEATLLSQDFVK